MGLGSCYFILPSLTLLEASLLLKADVASEVGRLDMSTFSAMFQRSRGRHHVLRHVPLFSKTALGTQLGFAAFVKIVPYVGPFVSSGIITSCLRRHRCQPPTLYSRD